MINIKRNLPVFVVIWKVVLTSFVKTECNLMIKVNNKVQATMGIIIEVHIEVDLIRFKAMKEKGYIDTEDLVKVK